MNWCNDDDTGLPSNSKEFLRLMTSLFLRQTHSNIDIVTFNIKDLIDRKTEVRRNVKILYQIYDNNQTY